jgi:hypothetical protein
MQAIRKAAQLPLEGAVKHLGEHKGDPEANLDGAIAYLDEHKGNVQTERDAAVKYLVGERT